MTDWKPIETAPNNCVCLVWMAEPELGSNVQTCRFVNGRPFIIGSIFAHDVAPNRPTHWMPLPEPPE